MNFSIAGDHLYNRLIKIDNSASRTFFLWGARQSGKSTLLHHRFADAIWIDLLKSDQFTRYLTHPPFAGDVGVAVNTIKEYFSILEDTLIGWFVPAFQKRPKRRTTLSPKFYFGDVGIVNALAKRGTLSPGNELFGKAFENWIAHELRSYNQYEDRLESISYWQLTTGVEVDFIIGGDAPVAIEAKSTTQVNSDHLKGLRQFKVEYPNVKRLIVVSLDSHRRKLDDGIEILPYQEFIQELWQGSLF